MNGIKENNGILAREGYPFIAIAFILFLIAAVFHFPNWLAVILFGLLVFTVAFFRNPERPGSGKPDEVLCPADGLVVKIERFDNDRFLKEPSVVVSIFMSPFNVHVNRSPLTGVVEEVIYNHGKYLNAASEKASLENEQNCLVLKSEFGPRIAFNQIAGMVARRIVCYAKPGDQLQRNQRYGMIRFGSRVDVHLPADTELTCTLSERVYAGDSILGKIRHGETESKEKSDKS